MHQTIKNFELLLIDDGSTDGSGDLCDQYQKKDNRIIVIHKDNGGQGQARNVGLNHASGDYYAFLDSDDYWDTDYLESLYRLIIKHDADISVCGYRCVDYQYRSVVNPRDSYKTYLRKYSGLDAAKTVLYWNDFGVAPWAKLFKASVWQTVRFKEDRIYEDLATTYIVYLKAQKVVYDSTQKMTYFLRLGSDARMAFNQRKMMTITTSEEILAYTDTHCSELKKAARCRAVASGFFIYLQIPKSKNAYMHELKRCKRIIKKYRFGVIFDRMARKKTRVAALLSYFSMKTVRMVFEYKKEKNPLF